MHVVMPKSERADALSRSRVQSSTQQRQTVFGFMPPTDPSRPKARTEGRLCLPVHMYACSYAVYEKQGQSRSFEGYTEYLLGLAFIFSLFCPSLSLSLAKHEYRQLTSVFFADLFLEGAEQQQRH